MIEYQSEAIEKKNHKKNIIKAVIKNILYILGIITLYNIFLISMSSLNQTEANKVGGYQAYIITTNSMEPNIREGDVIIIKQCDEQTLKEGDIITFRNSKNEFITHRIISIEEEQNEKLYVTKGDNNTIEDLEKISFNAIEGILIFRVPFLGNILLLFRNRIYLVLLALVIILIYLYTRKREEKKRIRREKKRIEDKKYKMEENHK
ncbi:MAG: signal peptidase I [Clostridia bacterium]